VSKGIMIPCKVLCNGRITYMYTYVFYARNADIMMLNK